MSLACRQCGVTGAFDTLIIFSPSGIFDDDAHVAEYDNFYTCCATFDDFTAVEDSRFAIVVQSYKNDSWRTGNNGPKLTECKRKKISEAELKKKLPIIYRELLKMVA